MTWIPWRVYYIGWLASNVTLKTNFSSIGWRLNDTKIYKITCQHNHVGSFLSNIGWRLSLVQRPNFSSASSFLPASAHSHRPPIQKIDTCQKNGINTCPPISEWNIILLPKFSCSPISLPSVLREFWLHTVDSLCEWQAKNSSLPLTLHLLVYTFGMRRLTSRLFTPGSSSSRLYILAFESALTIIYKKREENFQQHLNHTL